MGQVPLFPVNRVKRIIAQACHDYRGGQVTAAKAQEAHVTLAERRMFFKGTDDDIVAGAVGIGS